MVTCREILKQLKSLGNPDAVRQMARFGISPERPVGVSIPQLRKMARGIGVNHSLARQLWSSGIHEARILASMIESPDMVTPDQMDRWARSFDSWDVCDQCCSNLFDKTDFAYEKVVEWTWRDEEFFKRAGFVLMACLAVHDKEAEDIDLLNFLPIIKREATDERNFVKKAVNWALRQIGKRNVMLNQRAVETAREIQRIDSKAAKWIASDALRELSSERVKRKLRS